MIEFDLKGAFALVVLVWGLIRLTNLGFMVLCVCVCEGTSLEGGGETKVIYGLFRVLGLFCGLF